MVVVEVDFLKSCPCPLHVCVCVCVCVSLDDFSLARLHNSTYYTYYELIIHILRIHRLDPYEVITERARVVGDTPGLRDLHFDKIICIAPVCTGYSSTVSTWSSGGGGIGLRTLYNRVDRQHTQIKPQRVCKLQASLYLILPRWTEM